MGLDAVGATDDQDGPVQHLEGPLRLCGKIHVSRGVQQGDLRVPHRQQRLLGENGDAPLPLHGVRIQKGISMVHTPQLAQLSRPVEQGLGEGGLSRVHVGQDADGQFFHSCLLAFVFAHPSYHSGKTHAREKGRPPRGLSLFA